MKKWEESCTTCLNIHKCRDCHRDYYNCSGNNYKYYANKEQVEAMNKEWEEKKDTPVSTTMSTTGIIGCKFKMDQELYTVLKMQELNVMSSSINTRVEGLKRLYPNGAESTGFAHLFFEASDELANISYQLWELTEKQKETKNG